MHVELLPATCIIKELVLVEFKLIIIYYVTNANYYGQRDAMQMLRATHGYHPHVLHYSRKFICQVSSLRLNINLPLHHRAWAPYQYQQFQNVLLFFSRNNQNCYSGMV